MEKEVKEMMEKSGKALEEIKEQYARKADKKDFEGLQASLESIKANVEGFATIEDKKLQDYIKAQQEQIDSLEQKIVKEIKAGAYKPKTMKEQLIEMVEGKQKSMNDKDFRSALKNREKAEFVIKASDITTASVTADSGTIALDQMTLPGVSKHPWRDTPLFAATPKRIVGEAIDAIRWREETSKDNQAAGTAEGSALSQSDAAWKSYKEDFYKIGHYVEFTEETAEDTDFVVSELNDLLTNGVTRKVESDMWSGAGSGSNTILGMIDATSGWAKDFSMPTDTEAIASPNYFDVLSVAKSQVGLGDTTKTFNKGYIATVAFVSPVTMGNLRRTRDDNGQYYIPMLTSQGQGIVVDGMLIVETFDLAADKFVVCNPERATAYIKRNLSLKTSENVGSNFLADVMTVKATIRLAYVHKNTDEFAFVYGDFSEAKAAIQGA